MVTVTHGARAGRGSGRYALGVSTTVLVGCLLARLVGGTPQAWAQWTINGANISYPTGTVGIGTTNSAAQLNLQSEMVGGAAYVTLYNGSGAFRGYLQLDVNQSYAFWTGGGNDFAVSSDNSGNNPSGAYIYLQNSSGNVGVRTSSPSTPLHVDGAITAGVYPGAPYPLALSMAGTVGGGMLYIRNTTTNKNAEFDIYAVDANGVTQGTAFGYDPNHRGLYFANIAANPGLFVQEAGNVGIGTATPATKLHVAGDAQVDGNIAAKYQDVAEWVKATGELSPGTVVIIEPHESNRVAAASGPYDTRVAGVVSTRPGVLLGDGGEGKAMIAHSGRAKVKVDAGYGPIAVGDLLVTSPTTGHAMRSEPLDVGGTKLHRPATLIGKALEPFKQGRGEILVLLTLQ